jgi:hypothetical protein
MSDAIRAETITITGHNGDEVEAYQAIPLDERRHGGVVVSYEGAGHAFFSVDRPSYNVDATKDGWKQIRRRFGRYLSES